MEQVRAGEVPARMRAQHSAGLKPVLLDVREPWEVERACTGTDDLALVCIPMNEVPARLDELDPAQPVWVLCHHGMRSAQVAGFLMRRGYAQVYNVAGGIEAWALEVDPKVSRY
jgi:rhodanese-related sulfurtransferase